MSEESTETSPGESDVGPDGPTDDGSEPGPDVTTGDSKATPGGRDVVVPLRLYKTVTVFSTLFAVATILAGFVALDRGTLRATASPEAVSLPLVGVGLGLIVAGSAVYAFSTRFRAEGMGKPKDDTAEESNDG